MDADEIVAALQELIQISGRALESFERIEEKLEDLIIEAKKSNQSAESIESLSREIAAIARREFDPLRSR